MPSYDLRRDFQFFLGDTDYLEPWGDASLVINLEVHRFARAYSEGARELGRILRDLLQRARALLDEAHPFGVALDRLAAYMPEFLYEVLLAVEGLRFVSCAQESGRPELCLEAAPEEGLDAIMHCLREDEPDLIDRFPIGLAIQWNASPEALSTCLKGGISFYGDTVDLDDDLVEQVSNRVLEASADHAGRYLCGLTRREGALVGVVAAAHESETPLSEPAGIEPIGDLVLPSQALRITPSSETGLRCIESTWEGQARIPLPVLRMETGSAAHVRLTTIQAGFKPTEHEYTQALLHLAGEHAAPVPGFPDRAVLFVRCSLLSFIDLPFPGIEKVMSTGIMAYGAVEGNRLVIRLAP
jgi:hypothetical protein